MAMCVCKQWILAVTITAWLVAMEVSADIGNVRGSEEYVTYKRELKDHIETKAKKSPVKKAAKKKVAVDKKPTV